jgi:hypothetical protein
VDVNPVRVAVVQAAPVAFDVERTLEKLQGLVDDAARQGARLAVFPEAFVSAYPKGLGFGARMGTRSPEGREEFRRYFGEPLAMGNQGLPQVAQDWPVLHAGWPREGWRSWWRWCRGTLRVRPRAAPVRRGVRRVADNQGNSASPDLQDGQFDYPPLRRGCG